MLKLDETCSVCIWAAVKIIALNIIELCPESFVTIWFRSFFPQSDMGLPKNDAPERLSQNLKNTRGLSSMFVNTAPNNNFDVGSYVPNMASGITISHCSWQFQCHWILQSGWTSALLSVTDVILQTFWEAALLHHSATFTVNLGTVYRCLSSMYVYLFLNFSKYD